MSLELKNVEKKVGIDTHIHPTSLKLEKNTINVLLGSTLAGKTTLMQIMAGLDKPTSGEIWFNDENVTGMKVQKRNCSMVYQQFINYPHLNVFENIAFPLKQRKIDQSVINEKVMDALKSVGLVGYEKRKIQELSGGQQQRVSLARSLVKNAKILLLDEPLVNLDYKLREQLREEFKNLFSKGLAEETILIYSTTDPKETMELNGEVIVLDEGKVLQVGSAKEIFENPNSLKVAEISNDPPMNIIEAKISDKNIKFEGIDLEAPQHLSKLTEDGLKIGLRSSDIELHENGHEFEVELAEISGSETLLHLKRGNAKIIVSIEEVLNFKIHDKVKINFKIDRAYAFYADGKLASSPFGGLNG